MRLGLCITFYIFIVLGPTFAFCQQPSPTNYVKTDKLSETTTIFTVANTTHPITIQMLQPSSQTNNTWEVIKTFAPYIVAFITLIVAFIALYQSRRGARYTYAAEILKFRLQQIQEFYAPAYLLIEQSRIVYEKLLWTIEKEKIVPLDGFRLLDHIFNIKENLMLEPLINRILETGKNLTTLISCKSGLIEGGVTPTFIEYQAHFAILNAASEQELSTNQKEGWHEFGYYPRILNREIHEGFKVVLAHLENYVNAGDKTICQLLGQNSVDVGKYRYQLLNNLSFYETYASDYAKKYDTFDMSLFRQRFIDAIGETRSKRSPILSEEMISILDAGCGTGRDTYEFLKQGYAVRAMDASPALLRECRRKIRLAQQSPENDKMKRATESNKTDYLEATFDEMPYRNEFDGIWAAASLLHIPAKQMEEILGKLIQALKPFGILFMSFKYGHGEHNYEPRYYTHYCRKDIRALLNRIAGTEEIRVWLSDARGKDLTPNRQRLAWILEKMFWYDQSLWLNVLVKKR